MTVGITRGYSHGALSRAVCCRFAENGLEETLPTPYRLHYPALHMGDHEEELAPGAHAQRSAASRLAVSWGRGDEEVELIGSAPEGELKAKKESDIPKKDDTKESKEVKEACCNLGQTLRYVKAVEADMIA